MEPLIVLAITFALLWLLFIRPQQRRVRAHQALVDSVQPGDQVILSAGIFGRIVEIGPEEMTLEVAPGVVLRVARQAVLRRVEDATDLDAEPSGHLAEPPGDAADPTDDVAAPADETGEQAEGTARPGGTLGPGGSTRSGGTAGPGGTRPGGTVGPGGTRPGGTVGPGGTRPGGTHPGGTEPNPES